MAIVLLTTLSAGGRNVPAGCDTVAGDPTGTMIYTLPNGLKLYMSVNRQQPKISTLIAVRVGSKNDPAETTGLAHYFEHLMFKGSEQLGTTDYAAEKPMLDEIERLFETYRVTADQHARDSIYHLIDSVSYKASLLAIPNEYDKAMALIGSTGTNAYTSYDQTCYVETIPSNRLDAWCRIQADRFEHPVLRGFHTELETIYEEKNMSMVDDSDRMFDAMMTLLFPNHPYGTQTVLGTREHLKNPSITNVKAYHDKWYVPDNIAIMLSGDFDPEEAIATVTRYWGTMEPGRPERKAVEPLGPLTAIADTTVTGPNAATVYVAWRLPAASDPLTRKAELMSDVLNNGYAGLMDLDLVQKLKVMEAGAFMMSLADHSAFILYGTPMPGQSLEEVRDLLLGEVEKLKKGDFDKELLQGVVNNHRLALERGLEYNDSRINMMTSAFINGMPWADQVTDILNYGKMSAADVAATAREALPADGYAVVYKVTGEAPDVATIAKPALTPIATNRDTASRYLTALAAETVTPIEPEFPDFARDITHLKLAGDQELLYTRNTTNNVFTLSRVIERGSRADSLLSLLPMALDFAGTADMTTEEVQQEFYRLACKYSLSVGSRYTYINLTGLSENMDKAVALLDRVIAGARISADDYSSMADRVLKGRDDATNDQADCVGAAARYMIFGPAMAASRVDSTTLVNLDPKVLTGLLADMGRCSSRYLYYGPVEPAKLVKSLNAVHRKPRGGYTATTPGSLWPYMATPEPQVFFYPFKSNQSNLYLYANRDSLYNPELAPVIAMYNAYFGGGMNSIVFQEMRESRSLCYSAWADLSEPGYKDQPYTVSAGIGTQVDKLGDALDAFRLIINDMPLSEAAFNIARTNLETVLRTRRVKGFGLLNAYIDALDHGIDYDINAAIYKALPTMTLSDITGIQQRLVKGSTFNYSVVADPAEVDMELLRGLGPVKTLTKEEIFGR